MKYGFIGLGNLACALIAGMQSGTTFAEDEILGFDLIPEKLSAVQAEYGITAVSSDAELVRQADVIVLTIKPNSVDALMRSIIPVMSSDKLLISPIAGRALNYFDQALGQGFGVIRVMTNINARVGAAITVYAANSSATNEQISLAEKLFGAVGLISELPEHYFALFTAIGGSAPAFVYLFIDALARSIVRFGMPKEQAMTIAAQTVLGSAEMVLQSGEHPSALLDRVCSPGGVTIEGIIKLQRGGFEAAIYDAVDAMVNREQHI